MNELLLSLYGCPASPERWRQTLDQLCDLVSVRSAVVQVLDYGAGRLHPIRQFRDSYSLAHREEHDRVLNNDSNPRLQLGRPIHLEGRSSIVRDEDSFRPDSPELKEIRRRREALRFGSHLGGVLSFGERRIVALVLHRSTEDDSPLGSEEENVVRGVLPHLGQALHLGDQLAAVELKSALLAEAVDMLGVGVLLSDSEGRISWANAAAQQILDRSAAVCERGGRIRATAPGGGQPLQQLLVQASGSAQERVVEPLHLSLGRGGETAALQLLAVGVRKSPAISGEGEGGVVLFLCEPGRSLDISPEAISDLFGISAAEARLTASLCNGASLRDYALQRGISEGTARIQLKRTLAKVGAPRQAELVRRVCTSLAASLINPHSRFNLARSSPGRTTARPI